MKTIYKKLVRKWDRWIYRRAFNSLRRMTLDNPGMSYLMELQIKGWNQQLEISPELKRATELFHDAIENHHVCDFEPTGQWSGLGVGDEGRCKKCGKITVLPC